MKTLVILAVLTALAAPACAQPVMETRSVAVRTSDLDLARPADADILVSRMNVAVQAACGAPLSRELGEVERVRSCKAQAMAVALRRLDAGVAAALSRNAARLAAR